MMPEYISKPQLVDSFSTLQIIKLSFSNFSSALTFRGDIYVWGPYSNEILPTPQKLQLRTQPPYKDLKISSNIASAIDIDSNLWVWSTSHTSNFL